MVENKKSPKPTRTAVLMLPLVSIALFAVLVGPFQGRQGAAQHQDLTFRTFQQRVEQRQVVGPVLIKTRDRLVQGELNTGQQFSVGYTEDFAIGSYLSQNGLDFRTDPQVASAWRSPLMLLLPTLLIFFILFMILRSRQNPGSAVMGFAKSRAKKVSIDGPKSTFEDVAGVDEVVEELQEIKAFLSDPGRFRRFGAKIPTGVLLYGPPGTGKTLLARAVAGETGAAFFSISGSDFVEMFVGVGASRVRDLFRQARDNQPSIVFIDEIDAVGRQRGAGMGGGSDEREQTLNQLLVEMDGFEAHDNVIVMAGTNRADVLDPALLRPGRFDRQIPVDRPDKAGRQAILAVHARGKPLAPDVDLESIAAQTAGFTGADLANVMNEAALLTARRNCQKMGSAEIEEATLRVVAGPEKKGRILSMHERLVTAYHEAGHALVAYYLPNLDLVQKISIISRGQALGLTITTPSEDKFMMQKQEIMNRLAQMLGGRAAEEVRFDDVTTGAANDLQRATDMARRMVVQYGMSEDFGLFAIPKNPSQPFLGRDHGYLQEYSESTAQEIDAETRRLIQNAYRRAVDLLRQHQERLDLVAQTLLDRETIDRHEFEALLRDTSPKQAHLHEKEPTERQEPGRKS